MPNSSLVRRLLPVALLLVASTRAHAAWIPDGVPLSPPLPNASSNIFLRGLVSDGPTAALANWQLGVPVPDFSGTNYSWVAERVDVLGNRPAPWTASGTTLKAWLDSSGFGTYGMDALRLFPDGASGARQAVIDHRTEAETVHRLEVYS